MINKKVPDRVGKIIFEVLENSKIKKIIEENKISKENIITTGRNYIKKAKILRKGAKQKW